MKGFTNKIKVSFEMADLLHFYKTVGKKFFLKKALGQN